MPQAPVVAREFASLGAVPALLSTLEHHRTQIEADAAASAALATPLAPGIAADVFATLRNIAVNNDICLVRSVCDGM